jgi:hypothetical protein
MYNGIYKCQLCYDVIIDYDTKYYWQDEVPDVGDNHICEIVNNDDTRTLGKTLLIGYRQYTGPQGENNDGKGTT